MFQLTKRHHCTECSGESFTIAITSSLVCAKSYAGDYAKANDYDPPDRWERETEDEISTVLKEKGRPNEWKTLVIKTLVLDKPKLKHEGDW